MRRLSAHESVATVSTVLLADSSNAAPETLEIQHLASSLPSCHSTLNDVSKMFEIVSKLSLNCFCETFCNCSTFTVNSGRGYFSQTDGNNQSFVRFLFLQKRKFSAVEQF